jgi:carboxymethylenebutenolidase
MGQELELKAVDGHELDAYLAVPEGEAIGAVVVVQEIFGVNSHIRGIADGYAKDGFVAIAPALFDRIEKGVELGYEGADLKRAYDLYGKLDPKTALLDVAAAFAHVSGAGKGVGVIGYCFGGLMTWLAATRGEDLKMRPDCVIGYYAGGIGNVAKEEPSCPVLLHFGAEDTHIGPEQRDAVKAAHPEVTIFVYEGAEHGFNCDQRASYSPDAAKLGRERSLEFLKSHIA